MGEKKLIRLYFFIILISIFIVFFISLTTNIRQVNANAIEYAITEGEAHFIKDVLYRHWAAKHGGVYVPVTEETPPNPYLAFIQDRDIITVDGKKLTLINPAYMTRQVFEMSNMAYQVKGHITSLNPIRPENKPDDWERSALEIFQTSEQDYSSIEKIDGIDHIRFIRAMTTEHKCLKCHAHQGYKVGDLRGAVSVSVPLNKYRKTAIIQIRKLIFSHATLLLIFLVGLIIGYTNFSHEVDKRAIIQLEIASNEKRLKEAHRVGKIGYCEYDLVTRQYKWSDELYPILEIDKTQKKLNYDTFINSIHPDDQKFVISCHEKSNFNKQELNIDYRLLLASSELKYVQEHVEFICENNEPVRMVITISDITNIKLNELARIESERKYRNIIATTNDGFMIVSIAGAITDVNESYCKISGYTMEELLQMNLSDLEAMESSDVTKVHIQSIIESGFGRFESLHRKKNGTIFPIEVSTTYYKTKDDGFFTSFIHDISKRKHSEEYIISQKERLANIINSSNVGTWEWNVQTGEAIFNEKWANLIGYTLDELSPLSIETWKKFAHPDDLKESNELLQKHFNGEQDYYHYESRIKHKNGSWIWVLDRGKVISWTDDGKPQLMYGTQQNITKRKEEEKKNKNLELQLQQSQKMEAIGTLTGGIAHDFNNILTPIMGYADMMKYKMDKDNPLYNNVLNILDSSLKARELIQQLLTFSRKDYEELAPIDIVPTIKSSVKLIRSTLPVTVDINMNIEEFLPRIIGTTTQIHQVILNLCINAYQAMEREDNIMKGKIAIDVKEVVIDENSHQQFVNINTGNHILIRVQDNGSGINQEAISHIFEPFYTTKEEGKGTGMGLAMVHGIINRYNGEVKVYSLPGKGTTFSLYIPVTDEIEISQIQDKDVSLHASGKKIIVIDDREYITDILTKMLLPIGFEIEAFNNCNEALENIFSNLNKYDLLISDLTMPEMTGIEMAIKIREKNLNIPIIILTGHGHNISENDLKKGKISSVIHKPILFQELISVIKPILNNELNI